MAVTTEIRPEMGRRQHTVTGTPTLDEIWCALKAIYEDPDYDPEMDALWDLRDANLSRFFSGEVANLATRAAGKWSPGGRARAALVVSTDTDFGMARMYEMLIDSKVGGEIQVFRDMAAAETWLHEARYPGESSAG